MKTHIIKVKTVIHATHDVLRIVTEKPVRYQFKPGQATEVSINKPGWGDKKRPFTFTSLPEDDHLEFVIKTYPQHKGVTNELNLVKPGDELIIGEPWGTIGYKGEGVFIAGGAGVTPFISILKHLRSKNQIGNNKLIYGNKTRKDIIDEIEFKKMLGENFINILSDEETREYAYGFINEKFIKQTIKDLNRYFYVCGPSAMMDNIEKQLIHLNISKEFIVKEEW
jgi:ferredoxin-NADP reductase